MTPVDIWTASASTIGAAAIAMRAFMLRPQHQAWTKAPAPVWSVLTGLGIALGMAAVSLWFGREPANGREALVDTALALAGVILLWNLHRNGRARDVERSEGSDEAAALKGAGLQ